MNSVSRLRSHSAKANMPRKRSTQSSPQASQACTITSVSLLGVEDVAQRLQLGDQLLVVVDLAVEDDDHRAVFVEQRLLAGGDVDDRQPPVAEAHAGLEVQAAFVRAAVGLRVVHALQHRAVHLARAAGVEDAGDAAHDGCRVLSGVECRAGLLSGGPAAERHGPALETRALATCRW